MTYSLNWNLETIFKGGVHGTEFNIKIETLRQQVIEFSTQVKQDKSDHKIEKMGELFGLYQEILSGYLTADLFVNAWSADDYTNSEFRPIQNQIDQLGTELAKPEKELQVFLAELTETEFENLLAQPELAELQFNLSEQRAKAQYLLDSKTEDLLDQLRLDSLMGWSQHYETLVAGLTLSFEDENGQQQTISAGQALNQIDGYPDAQVRRGIMQAYEKMWTKVEDLAADTLNHLAGARLTEQKARGYQDYMEEPLALNRMSAETLNNMWSVVDAHKDMFKPYFERRAQLMDIDKLGWQDQTAPLTHLGTYQLAPLSYDEAAKLIITNFGQYSSKMAQFAQNAFEKGWIEAEDRPGKQPGGWMESVPDINESRIFLTFTGSPNDAATIAHELGHGFHTSVLQDLPYLRNDYAMNVAETASTFAELIVNDANVQSAQSDAERVMLLDAKLANPVAMFLNIHARYLFENEFYQARQEGYVTASRLNQMMENAQKTAFRDSLSEWHPHFWASKLHFYADDVPFYNFPYTFGYLFSAGIYAWAKIQPNFEEAYISLLRDTAAMSTEELAQKHLGVDLTKPDFFEAGVSAIQADIDQYLDLSEPFI